MVFPHPHPNCPLGNKTSLPHLFKDSLHHMDCPRRGAPHHTRIAPPTHPPSTPVRPRPALIPCLRCQPLERPAYGVGRPAVPFSLTYDSCKLALSRDQKLMSNWTVHFH